MPNFTTEDLLLFMYNEMDNYKKTAVEQELQNNWALREKLQVLKESEQSLKKVKLQGPRNKTIDAIMQYASPLREVNFNDAAVEYLWRKGAK